MTAHSDDHSDLWLWDWDRSVHLCDIGTADLYAITAVGPNGDEQLMVGPRGDGEFPRDIPDHERTGPLPADVAHRVRSAPLLVDPNICGRPTAKGRPCRLRVSRPGDACQFHTPANHPPATQTTDREDFR